MCILLCNLIANWIKAVAGNVCKRNYGCGWLRRNLIRANGKENPGNIVSAGFFVPVLMFREFFRVLAPVPLSVRGQRAEFLSVWSVWFLPGTKRTKKKLTTTIAELIQWFLKRVIIALTNCLQWCLITLESPLLGNFSSFLSNLSEDRCHFSFFSLRISLED